ncbi:hypothetical protein ASD86_19280 [Lysobacter sp. Root690]|nr:hypothetical protein ASD86_19280 [Lysobacter sp. Root690]
MEQLPGIVQNTILGLVQELTAMNVNHSSKMLPMVLAVVVAGVAALTPRPAQAVFASEFTQIANNIQLGLKYAQQVKQYEEQVKQLQEQVKAYEQMALGQLKFQGAAGYREDISSQFPERDINEGVDKACGKEKNNPVAKDQHKYCIAIVQTENRRYNAMVKMLKDVSKRDKELEEAYKDRAKLTADKDQGKLQTNTNYIAALQAQMANDVQNGKYMLDAYTSMLRSLNENMVRSANMALKNKNSPSIIDTAIQGGALKLALQGARSRER